MNARVNLLRESEYRRQGAVSNAFILRMSVVSVLAFTTLFAAIFAVRFQIAHRDLMAARQIWAMREPIYTQVQSMKQDLALMKKLNQELNGWEEARTDWVPVLDEIARLMPPTAQLRRFNVRGETEIKAGGSAAPALVGGLGDVQAAAAKPVASAGLPGRRYYLTFDGKASGDMAEAVVVQFVRTLGRSEVLSPILDAIKLASLQREAAVEGGEADRRFVIEASTIRFEMRERDDRRPAAKGGR